MDRYYPDNYYVIHRYNQDGSVDVIATFDEYARFCVNGPAETLMRIQRNNPANARRYVLEADGCEVEIDPDSTVR